MITLDELNRLPATQFVATLGSIFEHSPWVAERVATQRPFASRLDLLDAMRAAVLAASEAEQLTLIRAHPELAGRAAVRKELTAESTREQAGAGLDQCSPEEFARLQSLNGAYNVRFAFPFILAVRGHTRSSVIAAFERRLNNDLAGERATALEQIGQIGGFRLADLVSAPLGAEIMAMTERLARFTETEGRLTCSYLTPVHRATAAQLREWMLAGGMSVENDAVGNVVGRVRSKTPGAKTLITGSHYDTVVDGGRYDGRLGVVLPIAVATELQLRKLELPFDLEIVGFADEEGVRYNATFIGSSALAGSFDLSILDKIDGQGVTMREALIAVGLDPQDIPAIARDRSRLAGYVEVHIEQGPVLLDQGCALGAVTAIAGSVRYSVTLTGLAGHAGTVPMSLRRDAAAAAAEIILAVERRCSREPGLVGTVGRLNVPGGAINVIPGRCELTLDVRAPTNEVRDAAIADVLTEIREISARRRIEVALTRVMEAAATPCAPALQAKIAASIARVTGDAVPLRLPSGAGHDAMKMAAITEVGMMFVRCGNGGISHHPDETMSVADADVAARAFEDFLRNFSSLTERF
jgi:N-carbamoyl-L-amino-acid hydrolase